VLAAALVACSEAPPATAPAGESPVASLLPAAEPGAPNRVMGTGEPRDPQPFTREQRLLDAVRRNDRPAVERALALGVSVEARDDLGRSALLLATRDAASLELVRLLRERGAAADAPDLEGRTPLGFAAEAGRIDLVAYLLEQGAVLDRRDAQQRTPLFYAVATDQREVVALLADRGADVDAADRFGDTPLMMACAKGFGAMAELLVAHGADPTLRDHEGRTAADRARAGAEICRTFGG
jgi:ankyrin repeat protein